MFMVAVIAAVAAAPVAELPKGSVSACGATIEKVELMPDTEFVVPTVPSFGWSPEAKRQALAVSYIIDGSQKVAPADEGALPKIEVRGQGPAVLLPNCAEPLKPKRRKRLSDYPMG
jgi:hypothetical protein